MNATLVVKWNFTARRTGYVLQCGGDLSLFDACWMGETREEALRGIADINARRAALGLSLICI